MAQNATTTKAPADYAKLADAAEVTMDGLELRDQKLRRQLNAVLKDVPERAAIMQVFERFADNRAKLLAATEKYARYVTLRDRPAPSAADSSTSS